MKQSPAIGPCGSLQSVEVDEDRPSFDRFADGVELVAVKPRPPVRGLPVVYSDNAEHHGFGELDARGLRHAQHFPGPWQHGALPLAVFGSLPLSANLEVLDLVARGSRALAGRSVSGGSCDTAARPTPAPSVSPVTRVLVDVERRGCRRWSAWWPRQLPNGPEPGRPHPSRLTVQYDRQRVTRGVQTACPPLGFYASCKARVRPIAFPSPREIAH